MRKIVIRGGGVVAGKGVVRSYADIIRDELHGKIELINISKDRDTTFDLLWEFDKEIGVYQPDILFLHFAIDDMYFPVYRSEFKENLVQIVRLVRKSFNTEIFLLTSHPFINEYDMNSIDIYYRVIREVSVDLDLSMIPIHTYFSGYLWENNIKLSELLQEDVRYPNEKGHQLYAKIILNKLEKIII
jgi:lysophospholipase L1-like esterase